MCRYACSATQRDLSETLYIRRGCTHVTVNAFRLVCLCDAFKRHLSSSGDSYLMMIRLGTRPEEGKKSASGGCILIRVFI